jgi:hypothetical protein
MAGDLELARPRVPGTPRPVGRKVATEEQRTHLYEPTDKVPVSGLYDVVNEYGDYLGFQITCHEGDEFPPTRAKRAHPPSGVKYRYKLAYEAAHLRRGPEHAAVEDAGRIFRPGEFVPTSGIYGVVDRSGNNLRHQRACVEHRPGEEPQGERRHAFPAIAGLDPDAFGYVLQLPAEHLRDD